MKRKNKILPLVLMGLITLSGCNSNNTPVNPDINNNDKDDDNKGDNDNQEHDFSDRWSHDENYHWHEDLCDHDVKGNYEPHNFKNGLCTVCGYDSLWNYPGMDKIQYKREGDDVILTGIRKKDETNIEIPDCITVIGDSVFYDYYGRDIDSITIPSSVRKIGDSAFWGVRFNCDVILPSSITEIGDSAFYKTRFNKNIILSNNITSLGTYCFGEATFAQELILPSNIKSLGNSCFFKAYFATEFNIPNTVTQLGESCFSNTNITSIEIPDSIKEIPDGCFYACYYLEKVILPDTIESIGGSAFSSCTRLKDINFTKNIKIIKEEAFSHSLNMDEVRLNDGLETIEKNAFQYARMKSIYIPDSVTSIGEKCFFYSNLETIRLSPNTKTLEGELFSWCQNLKGLEIPEGVEVIKNISSRGTIYLPSTIKEIEGDLGDVIYYNGTFEDLMKIDSTNYYLSGVSQKYVKDANGEYYNIAELKKIVVSEGTAELNRKFANAFLERGWYDYYAQDVESITIPKSVTKIDYEALVSKNIYYEGTFEDWMNIEIPEDSSIFYGTLGNVSTESYSLSLKENKDSSEYTNIDSLTLPETIEEISNRKFRGFKINSNLEIPANCKRIGRDAFSYTRNLTSLKIDNPSCKIESGAFAHISLKTLTIDNPDGVIMDVASNAFEYAFYNLNLIYNGTKESFEANTSLRKALKWYMYTDVTVTFPDGEVVKY